MTKRKASVSDLRLKRVMAIHQMLRNRPSSTDELLENVLKIDKYATKRTVKSDIEFIRGLGAEIPKGNKHHPFYYKKPFSLLEQIEGIRLSETNDLLAFVQQTNDKTPAYLGLDSVLLALEQRVRTTSARKNPYIAFETVESEGLKRIDEIYRMIIAKRTFEINYTPFGEEMQTREIYPLFLKEYNNRWTLIGYDLNVNAIQNFPIERIGAAHKFSNRNIKHENKFNIEEHFKNVIGVSVFDVETIKIRFKIFKKRAYYVATKKIHSSQILIEDNLHYMVFEIYVKPNQEMWAKFMELAEDLEILSPKEIATKFFEKISTIYLRIQI